MNLKIEAVFINFKSKAGVPFKTPMLAIKSKDLLTGYQKDMCSGFVSKESPALQWKVGDVVELEIAEKNGYLNFEDPFRAKKTPVQAPDGKMVELENRISALEAFVFPAE